MIGYAFFYNISQVVITVNILPDVLRQNIQVTIMQRLELCGILQSILHNIVLTIRVHDTPGTLTQFMDKIQ